MQPHRVNHYLQAIVTEYQVSLEEGVIVSVSEGQIRSRTLPLQGTGTSN